MFRQGLARVLDKEPFLKVVGQCASSAEALAVLKKNAATMVLLNVDLGAERALDFVIEAKQSGYPGQILVATAGASGQEAVQLVQAGVAGILHKHNSIEVLGDIIRRVATARPAWRRSIWRRYSDRSTGREPPAGPSSPSGTRRYCGSSYKRRLASCVEQR